MNAPGWAPILTRLYNACFSLSVVPESWRGSTLCPIYKQGDTLDPANYRMIALLDVEGKGFADNLLDDLEKWVETNKILPFTQNGFRSRSSTLDNIITLAYLAYKARQPKSPPLFCCLVDYSAAFDRVNRNKLWAKLALWGLPVKL